jgi:hypothetical protein
MNNPKEKAKELVDKFWYSLSITLEQAKKSALIAVDEILESHYTVLNGVKPSAYDYWQQVKQEIKAL